MPIRLGLHISTSTEIQRAGGLLPTAIEQVREAEAAGFDVAFVADQCHWGYDAAADAMLAACATLGALATATEQIRVGALVTGTTYRNPALIAGAMTTLDELSRGRAILGMAMARSPQGHDRLNEHSETHAQRLADFEQTLQIIAPMVNDDLGSANGQHRRLTDTATRPRRRPYIPLVISAGANQKMIPVAVKHADHVNIRAGFDELPATVGAIRQCCEDDGRDPETLETSALVRVRIIDGVTPKALPSNTSRAALSGTVQFVAEQLHSSVLSFGIGGLILDVLDYTPGVLEQLSAALELNDAAWPLLWPARQTVA